jgi:ABC-type transport system substrate-binding protein
MLTKYEPSIGFTFKRHPEYWDQDWALADTIEMPIVPEYAATLAQFKAGNLYSFSSYGSAPKITAEDVLPVKREEPRISVYQSEYGTAFGGTRILIFGWLPEGKSPYTDERVRQAILRHRP